MARHINLGCTSSRSLKGCQQFSSFDTPVFACEIHIAVLFPEGPGDSEEFIGACIALVMVQKITVTSLLQSRTSGNDVQRHTSLDESGERVHLLHERCGLHQAEAIGDYELEFCSQAANGTGHQHCVRFIATEGK